MAKRPGTSNTKKRVPRLTHSASRGIGWHVSFRDPKTGVPRKHRFRVETQPEAEIAYHEWLAKHLRGDAPPASPAGAARPRPQERAAKTPKPAAVRRDSLLAVASSFLAQEERRARKPDEPKRPGTIAHAVYLDRKATVEEFLGHLSGLHGDGSTARMTIADLSMEDVEEYNRGIVGRGLSESQVSKRMQMVKKIVARAGRPEHGGHRLAWNWDSLDLLRGAKGVPRPLPTLEQLQAVLRASELRERTLIWMGIGLGFGQRDLASVHVNTIDAQSYDLRRGKTDIERYGETPPLVWACIQRLQERARRKPGDLLFTTRNGMPLVHGSTDSVHLWWTKLRASLGPLGEGLSGFYVLRHVGATEYGSRPGTSISGMKLWLGHGASGSMADVYMRPVRPEHRPLVDWVRQRLASSDVEADTRGPDDA